MSHRKMPRNAATTRLLLEWAEEKGWSMEIRRCGHVAFTHPRITGAVFTSQTPRCPRAWLNARAEMRRKMLQAGFTQEEVR